MSRLARRLPLANFASMALDAYLRLFSSKPYDRPFGSISIEYSDDDMHMDELEIYRKIIMPSMRGFRPNDIRADMREMGRVFPNVARSFHAGHHVQCVAAETTEGATLCFMPY